MHYKNKIFILFTEMQIKNAFDIVYNSVIFENFGKLFVVLMIFFRVLKNTTYLIRTSTGCF